MHCLSKRGNRKMMMMMMMMIVRLIMMAKVKVMRKMVV